MKSIAVSAAVAIAAAVLSTSTVPAFSQSGKCTSVQARCAVEIGGECDPKTGNWRYGWWHGRHLGGTIALFNYCISNALAKRK